MKRLLSLFLCICLLLTLAACGEKALEPEEANRLVIWHDKDLSGKGRAGFGNPV